jgi:hypothetical protein
MIRQSSASLSASGWVRPCCGGKDGDDVDLDVAVGFSDGWQALSVGSLCSIEPEQTGHCRGVLIDLGGS